MLAKQNNAQKSASTIGKRLTITPCLLFILQSIYLHNPSPHMSSQPITSRTYQRLLYLLTNQIAHQGFWIFNWLTLPLDSEDGFRTGCRNVSHQQQSFSGLLSPRWSFSMKEYPVYYYFTVYVLHIWIHIAFLLKGITTLLHTMTI